MRKTGQLFTYLIALAATTFTSSCQHNSALKPVLNAANTIILSKVSETNSALIKEERRKAEEDSCRKALQAQEEAYKKEQSELWFQLSQYIVGMRIDSTNIYYGLTQFPCWTSYQQRMWCKWDHHRKNAAKAAKWSEQFVEPFTANCKQLLYAFSGADWPYAHTFFPDVEEYILLAAEPIGKIPAPNAYMTKDDAARYADALYNSTRNIWGHSFFVTKNMAKDLRNENIDGVLPLFMMFMGRDYIHINSIETGRLKPNGDIDTTGGEKPNILRMETEKDGQKQTITYIQCDLSNLGLKKDTTLMAYLDNCVDKNACAGYLKAASYLPHYNSFSTIRDVILDKCKFILEDDSGIKYAALQKAGFKCLLWGDYVKPIDPFKNCLQKDLAEAYADTKPELLDFQLGYGSHFCLIGAIKDYKEGY